MRTKEQRQEEIVKPESKMERLIVRVAGLADNKRLALPKLYEELKR